MVALIQSDPTGYFLIRYLFQVTNYVLNFTSILLYLLQAHCATPTKLGLACPHCVTQCHPLDDNRSVLRQSREKSVLTILVQLYSEVEAGSLILLVAGKAE